MPTKRRRFISALSTAPLLAACLLPQPAAHTLSAAEKAVADTPVEAPRPQPGLRSLRIQESDDLIEPLVPKQSRGPQEQAQVDASAWFMTGAVREKQNDLSGALDAYRKAIAIDPNAVEVYQALIPLAFTLNQTDDAVKYALKALELDPQDYSLLQRLGVHMASNARLADAIQLFERAAESSGIDKHSETYVMLMRDLAVLYAGTGSAEKAADAFEVVFEALQDPEKFELSYQARKVLRKHEASSYERIGQAFLSAERPEMAIKAFELAAKEGQGLAGNLGYNLATVYLQTKKPEKALAELQKYLDAQLRSKGQDAYDLLAKILTELDREDEVLSRLESLAEKDPRNSTLQYYLARQYMEAGRLDEAEDLYQKTLKASGDAQGYAGLAAVYRRQHRPSELLEALAKAITRGGNAEVLETELQAISSDEKMVESLLSVGRETLKEDRRKLDFPGALILAKLAATTKKTEPALEFYRLAIADRPDRASALYQEAGQYLFDVEAYKEATTLYKEAVENVAVAAERPNWLFRLSQAAEMSGQTDEALAAVNEAQKLSPHALLEYQEGWIYFHAGRDEDAVRQFEHVIEKFPQEKEIVRRTQMNLSALYVQQGEMRKGEEILERIYAEEPDNISVNNDLGYLYADQGKNLEQAEKMIRKAVAAEPDNAAYVDSLGWVLFKLGKADEALPHLEKAATMEGGGDATIWDHLGDVHDRLGNTKKAVEAWQKALEEGRKATRPDTKMIERIEQKLERVNSGVGALRPAEPDEP